MSATASRRPIYATAKVLAKAERYLPAGVVLETLVEREISRCRQTRWVWNGGKLPPGELLVRLPGLSCLLRHRRGADGRGRWRIEDVTADRMGERAWAAR
jgi:hypothetical protein